MLQAVQQLSFNLIPKAKATNDHVSQFEPMVHKFVNQLMRRRGIADGCMDRDDLVQTAWMYVVEAINQYDESRGAKLSTFVFLKLMTKFSNIGRKLTTYQKKNVVQQSQLHNIGAAIDGYCSDTDRPGYIPGPLMEILWDEMEDHDTKFNVNRFLMKLPDKERRIAVRYFIEGQTQQELKKRRPNTSMAGIRDSIRNIREKAEACLA